MILHFYMAFPLCIPEQFAQVQLLYQLFCTYSLKMQWEQRPCVLFGQNTRLPPPSGLQESQNYVAKPGKR